MRTIAPSSLRGRLTPPPPRQDFDRTAQTERVLRDRDRTLRGHGRRLGRVDAERIAGPSVLDFRCIGTKPMRSRRPNASSIFSNRPTMPCGRRARGCSKRLGPNAAIAQPHPSSRRRGGRSVPSASSTRTGGRYSPGCNADFWLNSATSPARLSSFVPRSRARVRPDLRRRAPPIRSWWRPIIVPRRSRFSTRRANACCATVFSHPCWARTARRSQAVRRFRRSRTRAVARPNGLRIGSHPRPCRSASIVSAGRTGPGSASRSGEPRMAAV